MEFKVKPFTRNIPDEDLLTDIRNVASKLSLESLSMEEYNKYGTYTTSIFRSRFGSWTKALKLAGLKLRKHHIIAKIELIKDLKRVASELNTNTITIEQYRTVGKYSPNAFRRVFGSWLKALDEVGLQKTRNFGISNDEFFENIVNVWLKLGRQPKYAEMKKPLSQYSGGAYEYRFGSWGKALEAFDKHVNSDTSTTDDVIEELPEQETPEIDKTSFKHQTKRDVGYRLRYLVLKRDNATCQVCGRSPANYPGLDLHIDHIKPWSKGGETVMDNLQALCSKCNLGKGDLD